MQRDKLLKELFRLKKLKNIGFKYCEPFEIDSKCDIDINIDIDSLSKLKQSILNCHLCSLAKSRQNIVFASGDESSELMIIGDAPSLSEDEQGRFFVGRNGEMLANMIEKAIGIPKKDVYITNIIKCKPPANRYPSDEEIQMCKPFLDKQIEMVNPKIVLALGNVSFKYLTGQDIDIEKARGKIYGYKNAKLIPSFHPSYLLRNPTAKKEAFEDMLLIKKLLFS